MRRSWKNETMGNRHFRSNTIWRISGILTFTHSVGIGIRKSNLYMCITAKCSAMSEKTGSPYRQEQPTLIPNIVFSPLLLASTESFIYQQYIKPVLTSNVAFLVFEPDTLWHKEILSLLNQVFEAQEQANIKELTTMRLLTSIWELLYENTESVFLQGQTSQITSSNTARLQMMMSFIHSHYADPIQLDDIAAFAHVSKNNCMQIFKNGIRQSPISYLIQYRLNKAAKLLAATEMKVATISEKCGFHDAPYFCRKFKEVYRISPIEYRKSNL